MVDKEKILIVGGDGMAGSMINMYLSEQGFDIYTTTRRKADGQSHFFDVAQNIKQLQIIVEDIKPDFVINCIGVLNQFAEDNKSNAVLINSYLPHYIDDLSRKYDFKFIHISTDCIFSGDKGKYVENDFPDAQSFYGRSKSLGEINNENNLTFRTSIIGPDPNEKGIGLFNWFMTQEGEVGGYGKAIWSGVTTLELAKDIEKVFKSDITGLYHLVNNNSIDKYNLLLLFKKYMNKDISIVKNDDFVNDKSFVNTRTDFNFNVPTYEQMIKEMSEWIENHKKKYEVLFIENKS